MPTHFHINLRKKESELKLTRENYIVVNKHSSFKKDLIYPDIWCEKHFKNCLTNFDLNMAYFSRLDQNKFINAIQHFLNKNP